MESPVQESGAVLSLDVRLPSEISSSILRHLTGEELLAASLASAAWASISRTEEIWRRACEYRWPEIFADAQGRLPVACTECAPLEMPPWVVQSNFCATDQPRYVPMRRDPWLLAPPSGGAPQAEWRAFYLQHSAYELLNVGTAFLTADELEDHHIRLADSLRMLRDWCSSPILGAVAESDMALRVTSWMRGLRHITFSRASDAADNDFGSDQIRSQASDFERRSLVQLAQDQPIKGRNLGRCGIELMEWAARTSAVTPDVMSPSNVATLATIDVACTDNANKGTLRSLALHAHTFATQFQPTLLASLFTSPRVYHLEVLDISNAVLCEHSIAALADGVARLDALHTLVLSGCHLGADVRRLAEALVGHRGLRRLDLAQSNLGSSAANMLSMVLLQPWSNDNARGGGTGNWGWVSRCRSTTTARLRRPSARAATAPSSSILSLATTPSARRASKPSPSAPSGAARSRALASITSIVRRGATLGWSRCRSRRSSRCPRCASSTPRTTTSAPRPPSVARRPMTSRRPSPRTHRSPPSTCAGAASADGAARAIARGVAQNAALTDPDLGYNGLGAATPLDQNPHPSGTVKLSLAINAVCEALRENTTLTRLSLAHNVLGDYGALAVLQSAFQSRSLRSLDLRANRVTLRGIRALICLLQERRIRWLPAAPHGGDGRLRRRAAPEPSSRPALHSLTWCARTTSSTVPCRILRWSIFARTPTTRCWRAWRAAMTTMASHPR